MHDQELGAKHHACLDAYAIAVGGYHLRFSDQISAPSLEIAVPRHINPSQKAYLIRKPPEGSESRHVMTGATGYFANGSKRRTSPHSLLAGI